jgi:hypothetical protein
MTFQEFCLDLKRWRAEEGPRAVDVWFENGQLKVRLRKLPERRR